MRSGQFVLYICPGCGDWAVEIPQALEWELGPAVVESVLEDHRAECLGLDAIATAAGL